MRTIRNRYAAALALALAGGLSLGGCASPPPPPPPPTIAEVTLAATMDANPDASGRPSPVVVRVYELTAPNALSGADFMQLYSDPAAALGETLRSRHEVTLAPGQRETLRLELKPDSRGIGVTAIFRDFLNANWRGHVSLPPNKTTKVQAEIGARHVGLTSASD